MFNNVTELTNAGYVRFEEFVKKYAKECAIVDDVCNETVMQHYASAQKATNRFVQGLYINEESGTFVIEAGVLDRVFINVTKDLTANGTVVFTVVSD